MNDHGGRVDEEDNEPEQESDVTRRAFLEGGAVVAAGLGIAGLSSSAPPQGSAPMTGKELVHVRVDLNGVLHTMSVDARATLLDTLREGIGLTGTKKGCDQGHCGACTVLFDGERVLSCLVLAASCDGAHVITVEGLARGAELHPIQEAFIRRDAFQCGYCTPGQLCSATALVEELRVGRRSYVTNTTRDGLHSFTSEREIRERMSGNICRCACYPQIVAAIQDVVGGGRGGA